MGTLKRNKIVLVAKFLKYTFRTAYQWKTRTSAGSKFSAFNFIMYETLSSSLKLIFQRSRSTTSKFHSSKGPT